ncbi:uncharacterized protein Asalp_05530 [Aeromonas salmonicida subsp. pectinolytica 34mel]|uniref:Uncharacterized protein n=1 Tax=Aeromonas salmonicida subsp. pectinolytica 34mel TaxID=1324960 RepID=A0A2D1QC32_AERSA|nr:uncharacterized protein Asalp_05530 [Aeromonas salmonicida subsp. pectinolytica 34mel]
MTANTRLDRVLVNASTLLAMPISAEIPRVCKPDLPISEVPHIWQIRYWKVRQEKKRVSTQE